GVSEETLQTHTHTHTDTHTHTHTRTRTLSPERHESFMLPLAIIPEACSPDTHTPPSITLYQERGSVERGSGREGQIKSEGRVKGRAREIERGGGRGERESERQI